MKPSLDELNRVRWISHWKVNFLKFVHLLGLAEWGSIPGKRNPRVSRPRNQLGSNSGCRRTRPGLGEW